MLLLLSQARPAQAQAFPFTSGPIPMCDTSTFTANVSGVGWLITPDGWSWGPFIENVVLNITTNHPQTLQISLTSPEGTTLLLSAFNGAGGQNYTNTNFPFWGGGNIVGAAAPFTGSYTPQGGFLSAFTGENADGVWSITVIDTACANPNPNPGPGGIWTPGWFNGGVGSGAFAFGFASPPPPCFIDMGSPSATICDGQSVDVLSGFEVTWGGMGITFSVWNVNTGTAPPDPYNVTTAGSYQVEGFDWSNCYYWGTYTVQVSPGIYLGTDQTVEQCSGAGPVNLTALFDFTGTSGTSWTLDGGPITNPTATAATLPGVYEVTATNAGCSDVAQVTLSLANAPVLGPDQNATICAGSSVDLTALFATPGPTPAWTFNGAPISPPTAADQGGTYTVSVVTVDGCTDDADVVLVVEAPPALGADQAVSICSATTLNLTTLYTTDNVNVAWSFQGAPVPNPFAVQQAGTYQLTAISAAGCSDQALVVVSVENAPVLGADLVETICSGETADLTTFFTTTGLATDWSFAGATVMDPASVSVAGSYTLMATNAAGCTDSAVLDLVVAALPALGADQQLTACMGTAVDLTTLYATGTATTAWTLDGAAVADPSAVTSAGSYTLTATSADGCDASALVTLQLDPAPALGADQSVGSCAGTPFDLTPLYATTGLNTEWTLGGAAITDPSAVSTSGNYQLVVANGFNCTDTAVVTYTANANPDLGADLNFGLCPWQNVDLSTVFPVGAMMATYTLNGAPVTDPTAVHDEGTYTVFVTDANGCTDEAVANVLNVECLCVVDFTENTRCMQEPSLFTLVADSAVVSAHWDFGGAATATNEIDPLVRFYASGDITVTLQATLSCGVVSVQRTVRVQDCSDSCAVYLPNAFTPDGDARNEAWTWYGECMPDEFTMEVYDRWGEAIFATNDPLQQWDGTYKGEPCPSGVYVYRVGYRLLYQKPKEVRGSITLVR
ncbi:MAG: gliding motility-associated C-terminal domain-containing protein [Flavobacteriales bacterium]|nr:gliding motility-associated C-terminal domain-containing protein [Flavobacteriales bacterium]